MLKIWLTWLQPSVGILGIVFILANAAAANAAPKSKEVNNTNKSNKQQTHRTIAKTAGTTIDRELSTSVIPDTPDAAIRQLALDAISPTTSKPARLATQTRPTVVANIGASGLSNFLPPSAGLPTVQPKPVARALPKKAPQPVARTVVPGLFIGNTEVRVASQFLPSQQPQFSLGLQPVAAKPTVKLQVKQPTAVNLLKSQPVMAAAPASDPFPVVNPARMSALQQQPTITTNATAVASMLPGFVDNNPLASIPAGLQRILGNDSSTQPANVAPTIAKAFPANNSDLLALSRIIDGGSTPTSTTGVGNTLKLDTAQAYASVPKFDLGQDRALSGSVAKIRTTKPVQAKTVFTAKQVKNDLAVAVTERKRDYVALASDRQISQASAFDRVRPTWAISYRSENTNLGGLILGQSTSVSVMNRQPSLLPQTTIASSLPLGRNYKGF
jgi:hypothetical protein